MRCAVVTIQVVMGQRSSCGSVEDEMLVLSALK